MKEYSLLKDCTRKNGLLITY